LTVVVLGFGFGFGEIQQNSSVFMRNEMLGPTPLPEGDPQKNHFFG
jgi:hypothetical protein